ncbi:hypothetical protein SK128_028514 [Halocaridina rubra]|uniref:Dynamin-binding protein n=1 Tax=Halocaridina rubra TaxID=373956 RepID=A0AAN8XUG0_HALRR
MSHNTDIAGTDSDDQSSYFSDFDDFDVEEESKFKGDPHHENKCSVADYVGLRRERVKELVATESNYIQDLEILIKITSEETTKGMFSPLDMSTLLGNISQVAEVAKKFLLEMKYMAYCKENEVAVGKVFLDFVEELSQVYKVYCSSYSVDVLPLIRKYKSEEETSVALEKLADELRKYQRHLLDLNSVLIKPVQRILKYPLYLEELVLSTPETHKDLSNLQAAKAAYQAAARDINEYTRSIDLVHRYRGDTDDSFHKKTKKISLHSLAKKSFRVTTKLSQKLGVSEQTLNSELDKLENEFRSVQKAAKYLVKRVTTLTEVLRNRQSSEFIISETLIDIFPEAGEAFKVRTATCELFNRVFKLFESEIQLRALHPARQILMLCEGPANLIQTTHKIMLDYDMAQVRLQTALEPSRIASVVEDATEIHASYEALSSQLLTDLPVFISHSISVLTLCVQSVLGSRMYLQGHMARIYLGLSQEPGLGYITHEMAQKKAKEQVDLLYQCLPTEYQKKHASKKKDVPFRKVEKIEPVELRVKPQEQGAEGIFRSSAPAEFFKSIPSISKGRFRRSYRVISTVSSDQPSKEAKRVSAQEYFKSWSPSARRHHRKASTTSMDDKLSKELRKVDLNEEYSKEAIHQVIEECQGIEENELTLPEGKLVAVLKKKDPMGGAGRWVVDDGEKIGLVKPHILKPYVDKEIEKQSNSTQSLTSASLRSPEACSAEFESQNRDDQSSSKGIHDRVNIPSVIVTNQGDDASKPLSLRLIDSSLSHSGNQRDSYLDGEDIDSLDEWDDDDYHQDTTKESDRHTLVFHEEGDDVNDGHLRVTQQKQYMALYDYSATDISQINLQEEQIVLGIHTEYEDWWYVQDESGKQGYVPASYLTMKLSND